MNIALCEDWFFGTKETRGKPCVCAGCWPNRTHSCPGCEVCEGVVDDCDGPPPEDDE